MPLSLHGIGVSRGYAIGKSFILQRGQPEVNEYSIPTALIEDEVQRFKEALSAGCHQLREIRRRIPPSVPVEIGEFIDTHLLMLEDAPLAEAPVKLIRSHQCNAEWALKLQRDLLVQAFEEIDDPYLRTRKDDVDHVVKRLQHILLSDDGFYPDLLPARLEGRIVIADDLTPADTILMQHQGAFAFVTEFGGPLSHTAILARSLRIPAVVGARNVRRYLMEEEEIVVDGSLGVVLGDLNQDLLAYYRLRRRQEQQARQALERIRREPAVTRDGVEVALQANIELPEDAQAVRQEEAVGVGLYRTEFLYMNRQDAPDEEEHLASYRHVISTVGEDCPIIIRTADLGADKQVDGGRSSGPVATNPALGLRGVRLCLKDLEMFRAQLRAILRASAVGRVALMIPMLSNVQEVFQVLRLLEDCKRELLQRGQSYDQRMPVGGMVEVPAAALCADQLTRYLDFLSIGTNDLIQYTLAIDRLDDEVGYLYDPLHPAVLKLIAATIRAGRKANIPVAMCGEMAGDARYTRLLLGLGLTRFSMHPSNLLEVKRVVKDSDTRKLAQAARRILTTTVPHRLQQLLEEVVRI
ncbi:MAG: phosphoenolpyruvate--protein phosphotransferase [Candidatus Competibacteraceae bacterium]|nr:phosphoenolpyruvate--protein phosphotransferase [Candidatus Competibacteraceae bacterium]